MLTVVPHWRPPLTSLQTARLVARCMSEKLPKKEGIPNEVRRWSEFIGGKPL
jgi:carbamoyl-phosphate synthase large subunit